jgi:methionyl-tRNA synthetase
MSIGQDANTFFSDCAPWAQVKESKELAEKTLSMSAIYTIVLGSLFRPFLPTMASKMLDFYPNTSEEQLNQLYIGNFDVLKDIFSSSFVVNEKPKPLIPKLDEDILNKFKEE